MLSGFFVVRNGKIFLNIGDLSNTEYRIGI